MASEIEIVNLNNFEKIQNFLNDSAYKEILENSENFNTRLCIERRLRMPFLDPQTGVAQTHCALFMKQRQRMPGFRDGQIYTYPSARWRKPKRQYLLNHHHSYRAYQYREPHYHQSTGNASVRDHYQTESAAIVAADGNSMSASGDNDSKDSHANPEKDWFHEDIDMSHYHHVDDFEDEFESDNDYDESYSSRGKRKRGSRSSRKSTATADGTPKRGRKGGGSRRRNNADGEGGGRRRGGANNANNNNANTAAAAAAAAAAVAAAASAVASSMEISNSNSASPIGTNDETSQSAIVMPTVAPVAGTTFDKTLSETNVVAAAAAVTNDVAAPVLPSTSAVSGVTSVAAVPTVTPPVTAAASIVTPVVTAGAVKKDLKNKLRADREVATPSTYCDFCLGDQRENKKTNLPEELVSCSDCGRSGHPSCLQFTPNMIISVKRYRWQCIECKYCSICGTSDNDDQLLFCDDCDRGYHMYCLSPPLITPPEGSWSCKLCMDEFHKDEK
ncbi:zinc finger protein ubi-d4 B [Zeugodacus cucurbitae]|uniref:Zinc finger protein ubi-d4 B n=1 Tax=Zeugodacus cucurbitae TaxID=28588 RepID=A0A0A1WGU5_ZEUCU|nr:zinc finger protein ubi-d4 B [Zeugodacus cucurbitae]XP_011192587.1 zinc finger protein ubi-d4 B [Zeugodacus cucurbitae]XP_028900270.1 zinc finger protein ubi-d4 B [Zeugodacus cucurbitae]